MVWYNVCVKYCYFKMGRDCMAYQFSYLLTDDDYIDFQLFCFYEQHFGAKRGKFHRHWHWLLPLAVAVLLVPIILWAWANPVLPTIAFALLVGSFVCALYIFVFSLLGRNRRFTRFRIKRVAKKLKARGKLPYHANVALSFGEDGLLEIADGIEQKVPYEHIQKIAVDREAFYIYIDLLRGFILPFSVFESPEQREEFLAFFQEEMQAHKGAAS